MCESGHLESGSRHLESESRQIQIHLYFLDSEAKSRLLESYSEFDMRMRIHPFFLESESGFAFLMSESESEYS